MKSDFPMARRDSLLRQTQLFNLTGHPAISLPCGSTSTGLPCGLQLVGGRMHTETLLRVALGIERLLTATSVAGTTS